MAFGTKFTLTQDHIKLLRSSYVRWDDSYFGAPSIDSKRPYGNSDVPSDIARILNWDYDEETGLSSELEKKARAIHEEMEHALQVVLTSGSFEPGEFVQENYKWKRCPAIE